MRSFYRSLPPGLRRDVGLVCLADAVVGVAFGAVTVSAGLPVWLPVVLSVLVFAGAAQFLFVAVVAGGGSPLAAATAGLLVNLRLVPLSLAVGDLLGPGWLRRVVGAHVVTDESVAFAAAPPADPPTARPGTERRRQAFWACGLALFVVWNAAVAVGALAGGYVPDADALGLDAAFPAVIVALVVPALRDPRTRLAAGVGAVVALAATFVLPAGLPVVAALVALPLTWLPTRTRSGATP